MIAATCLSSLNYETVTWSTEEELKDMEATKCEYLNGEIDDIESSQHKNMSNEEEQERTFLFVRRATEKYCEGGEMEITWDNELKLNPKDDIEDTSGDLTVATLRSDYSLDHYDYDYDYKGTTSSRSIGSTERVSLVRNDCSENCNNNNNDKDSANTTVLSFDDECKTDLEDASMDIMQGFKKFNDYSLTITNIRNNNNENCSTSIVGTFPGESEDVRDSSSTQKKQDFAENYMLLPLMEMLRYFFLTCEGGGVDIACDIGLKLNSKDIDENTQGDLSVATLESYPALDQNNGNNNNSNGESNKIISFTRNDKNSKYYYDIYDDYVDTTELSMDDDYDALLTAIMEEYKKRSTHDREFTTIYDHIDDHHAPFKILGTSLAENSSSSFSFAQQKEVQPQYYVLSPPIMYKLLPFFPYSKRSDNFWLRYSLVRDGASMHTLLESVRGAKHSIIALETMDGEVFGSFTSEAWRKTWGSFGTGESFLWKMRHPRDEATAKHSGQKNIKNRQSVIMDIIQKEREIDVYPYVGDDDIDSEIIQICNHDKIVVGGGTVFKDKSDGKNGYHEEAKVSHYKKRNSDRSHHQEQYLQEKQEKCGYGFGLYIQKDMTHGTTSRCVPFGSPSLSRKHADGSLFEIRNLELWSLTPCMCEKDAQRVERISSLFM